MKKQPDLSGKELRKRAFETRKNELDSRVDESIASIDASAPEGAVEAAERVIAEAAKRVEACTAEYISSDLQAAVSDVASSSMLIVDLKKCTNTARAELDALPPCGGLEVGMAILWLIGAAAAFFTELKLTDSLVALLGYRRDDPTGRAIGAAFASALLVFEVILTRLALVTPPAWLLRPLGVEAREAGGYSARTTRSLRIAGVTVLVLTLVGIAWLQVVTVLKIAPTRSIYATVLRSQRPLTTHEDQILNSSTLFFSVCVLVSGGFMAAAGTRELSFWLRRKSLERQIGQFDGRRLRAIAKLDEVELPALAEALAVAGLPSVWVCGEPQEDAMERLRSAIDLRGGIWPPLGIRAAAEAEAGMFEAAKRIVLTEARARPPTTPRPSVSWRDIVDDELRRAAS